MKKRSLIIIYKPPFIFIFLTFSFTLSHSTEETIAATELPVTVEPTADDAPATENAPAAAETKESKPKKAKKSPAARKPKTTASHPTYFEVMEGVDRLNELSDEMLVYNIMSRLDCTTKELIRTTATISKRWKNLWTSLPRLIFSSKDDDAHYMTGLHGYISFIDNTLNQCPTNLNLKKFKLYINYSSLVNSEFKSRANSWIRYAISRNVEEVDLRLYDVGGERHLFSYDEELLFNNSCFNRVKLSSFVLNPPNGAISWERLKCLCLSWVTLDEDMIEKILSGSPCLESLELKQCYGYRLIDVTSKSVKKLVFFAYFYDDAAYYCGSYEDEDEDFDSIKINAPYISSLTIKGGLDLGELVLLNVSSLVEVDLDYVLAWTEFETLEEEMFKGLLESLGHVKDITFGDHCSELLSRLKAGSDTVDDDRDENGD